MLNFITESGTQYHWDKENGLVQRMVWDGTDSQPMRRDGEWLRLEAGAEIVVGHPARMILEGLGTLPLTIRTTSTVVAIENTGPERTKDE